MSATEILSQARELPLEAQREIAETLLNELEQEESPELIAELDRRLDKYEKNPNDGAPWAEVKARLQRQREPRQ